MQWLYISQTTVFNPSLLSSQRWSAFIENNSLTAFFRHSPAHPCTWSFFPGDWLWRHTVRGKLRKGCILPSAGGNFTSLGPLFECSPHSEKSPFLCFHFLSIRHSPSLSSRFLFVCVFLNDEERKNKVKWRYLYNTLS